MRKLAKIVATAMALCLVGGCAALCAGCGEDVLPEYESGEFKYAVRTEKDGTQKAYLTGFTARGVQRKVLVYPEYIDGIRVYGMHYDRSFLVGTETIGYFESSNLEKMYFPEMPLETSFNTRIVCPNARAVLWDLSALGKRVRGFEGRIYGYEYYMRKVADGRQSVTDSVIANVSYMYNYSGAEDGGYYWVDSYDNSTIFFMPPNPQREGYLFGGWYKEPECINQWNFATDVTGDEIVIEEGEEYSEYGGVCLYARWMENK